MDSTSTPVLLLSAWSTTTTLRDWAAFPPELRKRTARAASLLPHKDSPRSRWERARVEAAKAGAK
jgi:hypothetical protein